MIAATSTCDDDEEAPVEGEAGAAGDGAADDGAGAPPDEGCEGAGLAGAGDAEVGAGAPAGGVAGAGETGGADGVAAPDAGACCGAAASARWKIASRILVKILIEGPLRS
ncbi:hypothetical protein GGQ76_002000 [Aureimonas jatrophae]|nr:hypothetical protein [Aureimonas jatrophae]